MPEAALSRDGAAVARGWMLQQALGPGLPARAPGTRPGAANKRGSARTSRGRQRAQVIAAASAPLRDPAEGGGSRGKGHRATAARAPCLAWVDVAGSRHSLADGADGWRFLFAPSPPCPPGRLQRNGREIIELRPERPLTSRSGDVSRPGPSSSPRSAFTAFFSVPTYFAGPLLEDAGR